MENPVVCEFKVIPGMDNDKAAVYLSGMSLEQLMSNTPDNWLSRSQSKLAASAEAVG